MTASLDHVLVARKRWFTAALCQCGLPGMLVLWALLKCLPISWLFRVTIEAA